MRLVFIIGLVLLSWGGSGCAYRLGPTNGERAGTHSVQVNPFEIRTEAPEPRVVEAVTFALRKHLQQDGTYKLDTSNEGDIIVTGVVTGYQRHSLSFQSRDALTPRDYRLILIAQVTARERLTGKVLLNRSVSGHSDIRIGPDLTSAERQALPLAAADLARNTTALLVDGSW
jgi:hypothetical protein